MNWFQLSKIDILKKLQVEEDVGLAEGERKKRLSENGFNLLSGEKTEGNLKKFFKHFNDLLIYVLLVAALLKGISQNYIDMFIILIVVVINALIGYIQESKASNSLDGLTSLMGTEATIVINGEKKVVSTDSLVKGDIVLLNSGDIIPADVRILEAYNLVVDEAMLTGESTPVQKNAASISTEADLADRVNMGYSGSLVNSGSGKAVVVETGDNTEIGKISVHLKEVGVTETPLIKKMKYLNKQIFFILLILIVSLVVFSFFHREFTFEEATSWIISLAVSSVPEGLPAVLSIILSLGVTRMSAKKAIIKKMPAVETLGSMEVICSDKTGTLTKNEMSVLTVLTKKKTFEKNQTEQWKDDLNIFNEDYQLKKLVETALYCNDTKIDYHNGQRTIIGNPTEAALLEWASHMETAQDEKVLYKIPFDSSYKYMATLVDIDHQRFIYLKGAPDVLLGMVDYQFGDNTTEKIEPELWEKMISHQAKKGQRMLATAMKEVSLDQKTITHEDLKEDMVLVGMYGIIDPPKPSAIEAIKKSHRAGISVKMITGDHKDTAVAIAKEIGLKNTDSAITGKDIETMTDQELSEVVLENDVFARTTPEHKLRLVSAIKAHGKIVGMTGDGVNDAPALKKADIGIAMGQKGTEVTKDAADMVLADDNFATISDAVREGRRVYDNLKNTIYFSLPTAFAQGLLVVVSILIDRPLPLTSIQILWLNMVTTITLSFALGFEKEAPDVMDRPPRDPNENILSRYAIFRMFYVSILLAALGFLVNNIVISMGASTPVAQTTLLMTLVFGQVFYMINCRSISKFSIDQNMFKNRVLWLSLFILLVLQLAIVYIPTISNALGTTSIGIHNLLYASLAGLTVFVVVELEKIISHRLFRDLA
ncbi:HAD-IC family P-type ATPase [Lactococcus garvieae]|jgi:calcium-translocating P-type ATPase|uniref:HAD-IC family P-type ATPase n=1 Tax=Lactococcus garvieae TaxID=1363 RepID=A0AAX3NEC4_9LACT|nr:HAD-IC family P-type ATPase [Lactococcus garvieae]WEA14689.1 HAD-IC family P-type ATPase [Lactococcus garvieae]